MIYQDILKSIESGKERDNNHKPLKKKTLLLSLKFYEDQEEFEKCQIILDYINKKFNHDNGYTI